MKALPSEQHVDEYGLDIIGDDELASFATVEDLHAAVEKRLGTASGIPEDTKPAETCDDSEVQERLNTDTGDSTPDWLREFTTELPATPVNNSDKAALDYAVQSLLTACDIVEAALPGTSADILSGFYNSQLWFSYCFRRYRIEAIKRAAFTSFGHANADDSDVMLSEEVEALRVSTLALKACILAWAERYPASKRKVGKDAEEQYQAYVVKQQNGALDAEQLKYEKRQAALYGAVAMVADAATSDVPSLDAGADTPVTLTPAPDWL